MSATADDYRWLVSQAAAAWLTRAAAYAPGDAAALVPRLRKDLSAERAHLVVEQIELRRRARVKFSRAERMFFTRKGLEQATDEPLAAYKAARFPPGRTALDLCCGIGGDLLALAARGPVVGCELDSLAATFAAANLAAFGYNPPHAHVQVADARTMPIGRAVWHIDPDRRPFDRRTIQAELFEPPLSALEQWLADSPAAAIKLAPATQLPEAWRERCAVEWLGSRGECRQQVAWCGELALGAGLQAATIVDAAGGPRTVAGASGEAVPVAESLGPFMYEPHAAVLAARLTSVLCREHDLAAVAPGIAYLTSRHSRPIFDAALSAFAVRDVLPLDRKQLKAYCREHRIGRLEVKKRGVDIDPEQLRKAVAGDGANEATLLVAPLAGSPRAIVAMRLARPG